MSSTMTSELSDIQRFYADSTIFITGASGFLGKLLLEKLLRSCEDVKRIYVLLRAKKGRTSQDRYQEFFSQPLFKPLIASKPDIVNKVTMMIGDCVKPNLGLSETDRDIIVNDVHCIFHCAATVRFDQSLTTATFINVRAVRDLIRIAQEMKQLKSFVHVSTAYSYCLRTDIGENFYQPLMSPDRMIKIAEELNETIIDGITKPLIGGWPNTYAFTKSIAEDLIKQHGQELPMTVLRPSIVISTSKEPIPGWIDNVYGPTGVVIAAALGVLRTLLAGKKKKADMVPADYVINAMISSAWSVGIKRLDENGNKIQKTIEPDIFNFVATPENPIDWETYMARAASSGLKIPTVKNIWIYILFLQDSKLVNALFAFFLHTIPAFLVDFLLVFMGKKPRLVDAYKKIDKFTEVISFFSLKEWNFCNKNTQSLWLRLTPADQAIFYFSMGKLDWSGYFDDYMLGCRKYLVNDPVETIPVARLAYKKLQKVHYCIVGTVCAMVSWGCYALVRCFV